MSISTWAEAVMVSAASVVEALDAGGRLEHNGIRWLCWSADRTQCFTVDDVTAREIRRTRRERV